MARDRPGIGMRAIDAYNRRDVVGLFVALATPDFEYYPGIIRALARAAGYRSIRRT